MQDDTEHLSGGHFRDTVVGVGSKTQCMEDVFEQRFVH
jgi:hypothetical protein